MSMKNDRRNYCLPAGVILLSLLFVGALFAPMLAPNDPLRVDLKHRFLPPERAFPMGTDHLGRCNLSRTLHGARISLGASLAAMFLSLACGMSLGTMGGISRRWGNILVTGAVDMGLSFPGFLLALVITGLLGNTPVGLVLAVASAGMAWWARFARDLTRHAVSREYVLAGRVSGASGFWLFRRYIFPQIWPPVLIACSLRSGWMILAVSGLGYLGLGFQPPVPEWGTMLQESRIHLERAPWLMMSPGVAITLTVWGFHLSAEGMRDYFQIQEAPEF
jgi:ABC-type dipeptide/oligopeptide/nickel transport system permease subunit